MNKRQVLELIANGENSWVEFKRDTLRAEQLAKEVVALANLRGGVILLGVDDDGRVVGLTRADLAEWVADSVFGRHVHPLILPFYEEVQMGEGKRVAVISVGAEVSKPYVVRSKDRETAYIRIGSISRPATREQLLMLGASAGAVHTEAMPVNRSNFDSLDLARLENYLREILRDPDVPASRAAWIRRLKALGLMCDGGPGGTVCTIAGLALFGVKPRRDLKQAGIRLMFFDSTEKQYQAQFDKILDAPLVGRFRSEAGALSLVDGGLIEQCLDAMEPFITIERDDIDDNFRRGKHWIYPFEAVRELLVNALAHRDWSRFSDVEVVGYSDRLEISSPGTLPNSMTVEKVLAGQRSARNHILVEVLRDYGYVDARGMGVRAKVVPALAERGREPNFEITDDAVKVVVGKASEKPDPRRKSIAEASAKATIRHKSQIAVSDMTSDRVGKGGTGWTSPRGRTNRTADQIWELLRGDGTLTVADLASRLGVTGRSVERNLRTLRETDRLRRVGGRKDGTWETLGGSG